MSLQETTTLHNKEFKTHQPAANPNPETDSTKAKRLIHPVADGYEVFHWPETQALLKKLGVNLEDPIISIAVEIPIDGGVRVIQEFYGLDISKELK